MIENCRFGNICPYIGYVLYLRKTIIPEGGSSPRMRGTLERPAGGMAGVWIIPADAGNTLRNPSICKDYLLPCNANQCNADQRNEINNAIEFDLKCHGLQ